jgi:hypothetical protein
VTKKKVAKKKVAKKTKTGRPSKFDTVDQVKAEKLARAGWDDKQLADFFGVTEKTWNNWKLAHPAFFQALKDWKDEADQKVERSLYERAVGYTHREEKIFQFQGEIIRAETFKHYPPDPTSMIFWLKNRKKDEWRDKQDVDVNPGEDMMKMLAEIEKGSSLIDLMKKRGSSS